MARVGCDLARPWLVSTTIIVPHSSCPASANLRLNLAEGGAHNCTLPSAEDGDLLMGAKSGRRTAQRRDQHRHGRSIKLYDPLGASFLARLILAASTVGSSAGTVPCPILWLAESATVAEDIFLRLVWVKHQVVIVEAINVHHIMVHWRRCSLVMASAMYLVRPSVLLPVAFALPPTSLAQAVVPLGGAAASGRFDVDSGPLGLSPRHGVTGPPWVEAARYPPQRQAARSRGLTTSPGKAVRPPRRPSPAPGAKGDGEVAVRVHHGVALAFEQLLAGRHSVDLARLAAPMLGHAPTAGDVGPARATPPPPRGVLPSVHGGPRCRHGLGGAASSIFPLPREFAAKRWKEGHRSGHRLDDQGRPLFPKFYERRNLARGLGMAQSGLLRCLIREVVADGPPSFISVSDPVNALMRLDFDHLGDAGEPLGVFPHGEVHTCVLFLAVEALAVREAGHV